MVLVDTTWLSERLGDDGLVVAEVDEFPGLYREGHIPGAVELDWRRDLQTRVQRDVVDRESLEWLLGRRGIANETTVVLYGDRHNWFAAYAYWYLKLHGHADVRLLDGGRSKWLDDGGELTASAPRPEARRYRAQARDESLRAYRDDVLAGLGDSGRLLVDVRLAAEYAGELVAPPGEEQDGVLRAGHIPTAISIPWSVAVRDDETFRPVDELRRVYAGLGVTTDLPVSVYCRIGVRSAHTWFVLRELLGCADVRNYDGSWTEWGNLVDVPIALGRAA
jgi:thiosulfate/3-mercaptopyruvate sulfurtransferase